ncbi:MFS transporter [Kitasatospora griseola]|uniref:MFS transporter n=1 Tax=Kitasatospora griseola TaxID=2064 RepID=UPI00382087A7
MVEHSPAPTYRELLGRKQVVPVIGAVTLGRLASGMVPFGMIALFTSDQQLGWAGAAFAAFLIGSALLGPYKGALVDRYGARRLLVPMACAFAATTAAAALLAHTGGVLFDALALPLTAAAAALAPPNSAVLRTAWTEISRSDEENTRLHSLDSVVEEATFVAAPLVTSGIWAAVGAQWAVVAGGLCALAGTLWFSRRLRLLGAEQVVQGAAENGRKSGSGAPRQRLAPVLFSRNGLALLVPMVALGACMGALSVGYPVWALRHATPQLSGVLMALDSVGGIVAGLVYGRLPSEGPGPFRRYFAAVVVLVVGVVVVAVSTTLPLVMVGSLIVGASLTPMYVIAFVLVGKAFPKDRHTLVNAGIGSAYNLGSGAAALAVGALFAVWPFTGTLLLAALLALLLGTAAFLGRAVPERPGTTTITSPAVEAKTV